MAEKQSIQLVSQAYDYATTILCKVRTRHTCIHGHINIRTICI